MKTWKNLYPEICSFDNLCLAARKAERGKRYRPEVYRFNAKLEENLLKIQRQLQAREWKPGKYRIFYVQEAKRRQIASAPYRDRVVHHALCNVLEPLFDRTFIFDSYACRKGKGTHAAADRYTEFSRKAKYCLKCDISKYFFSVRHDLLFRELTRHIADPDALWLCERIIRSWNDNAGIGIPIGNQTSQFFANIYLNNFDHWAKRSINCDFYLRYVDDFAILSDDKRWLHSLIPQIEDRLARLGLTLHPKKRAVSPVLEGCDFMGYRIWPTHRLLRSPNGYRFRRNLRFMARARLDFKSVRCSVSSWVGHACHANTHQLREAILGSVVFAWG